MSDAIGFDRLAGALSALITAVEDDPSGSASAATTSARLRGLGVLERYAPWTDAVSEVGGGKTDAHE